MTKLRKFVFNKLIRDKLDETLEKNERGGFDLGLFIESIEICSENPACTYYQSRPQQYPEIT